VHSAMSEGSENRLDIRRAASADWDELAELLAAAALPIAGAREHLDSFVIATRGGPIVGSAAVEQYDTAGLLRSVAVAESERGRGTGAQLVERCIADATSAKLSTLVLLTTTADRYFPRFGFETVERDAVPDGVRSSVEFREACPASAIVMRLALDDRTKNPS
jgi:N-acetylglutamate synthase-like GNAT family acetyltransferase